MKKRAPLRNAGVTSDAQTVAPRMFRNWMLYLAIMLITAALAGGIQLLPYTPYSTGESGGSSSYELARVAEVLQENLTDSEHQAGIPVGTQTLRMELLSGRYSGHVLQVENYLSTFNSVKATDGETLVVIVESVEGQQVQARVYNYYRAPYIYALVLLFFIALYAIGGRRGLLSGVSLIYTMACVFFIFLPLVLRGYSPIWSVILLVVLVSCASMLLMQGLGKKSLCAMAGTISGVVLSGIILLVFSALMHLSGFHTEEAESLLLISQTTGLKVGELLFAGILIAALGAVMDIAMSVVAAMSELRAKLPELTALELFKAGMNVGRDMIGTMSNTLILAFTGTALGFILLMASYSVSYNQMMNMNAMAIEFTQAFSGSLGLVLTVPVTAAITARLLTGGKLKVTNTRQRAK